MTSQVKYDKINRTGAKSIIFSAALTAVIFMSAIYLSDDLGGYVEDALLLSVRIIIPSIFPFIILTDFVIPYMKFDVITPLKRVFERLFKINGSAIPIYLCGILCGFPIGAKMAYDAERRGTLSKCECERLMAFANNAGPSYVISAVGASIRGSVRDGIILYVSMVLSSVITGILIGIKKSKSDLSTLIIEQKYSFTNSVKGAAVICINVCAFISTFGIFVGLSKKVISNSIILSAVISLLEIGNAALHLASLPSFSPILSLVLTSFAISFSGFSVIFQTLAIQDKNSKINARLYVTRKLLQGVISAMITLAFFFLISLG